MVTLDPDALDRLTQYETERAQMAEAEEAFAYAERRLPHDEPRQLSGPSRDRGDAFGRTRRVRTG